MYKGILRKNIWIFGVPLLMACLMVLLANSSMFGRNPEELAAGIIFDLVVTSPLIYYFLIRKTRIPRTTVLPVVLLGVLIGYSVLPPENQYYLNQFKTWGLPLIEVSILGFVIYKVRKAIKRYSSIRGQVPDFFSALKTTCQQMLPRTFVMPVVMEIAVFYYGFIYWKRRVPGANEFSYHKESGTFSLLAGILFLVAIETTVLHVLLDRWSTTAAWIVTAISVYSGIQIFGFLKSMLKRPIAIRNDRLYLRYGIMSETTIELKDIDSIELSTAEIAFDDKTRKLSVLGSLESHNTLIHLKRQNELSGLYGVKRQYTSLALHVDQRVAFKNALDPLLETNPADVS